jgi:nuclear transport factor 2 (NTF2) superfamily protein
MPILDMSESALQQALTDYEALFSRGDVERILEDFADDVRVHYASFAPFVGKDKLGAMLRRRFATMRDYRLKKQLEFVQAPRFASSWTGTWVDVASDVRMELFGLELLTVRNGRFSEWSASVSVWRHGEGPAQL